MELELELDNPLHSESIATILQDVKPRESDLIVNAMPDPISDPPYLSVVFDFERNFKYHDWRQWMEPNWKITVHFSFVYVMAIFLGQIWMKPRQPWRLKSLLTIWNLLLAAFSVVGFLRSLPELLHLLDRPNGLYRTMCSREGQTTVSAFWSSIGTVSKAVELGDTAFIVLRKQPLIFLHWYHHITVMLYVWYTFEDHACHRWFIVMNYFVHAVMYSYYALRAMGYKLPRGLSMTITTLQLLQMIVGVAVNIYSLVLIGQGVPCARKVYNIQLALLMYFSYLVLFAHFFYTAYFSKKPKSA